MKRVIGFGLLCGALAATPVRAQVSQAYLLSEWSTPVNDVSAPFSIAGTRGVQLTLNSTGKAVAQTDIAGVIATDVMASLRYYSHTGRLNPGETFGSMSTRVNSEIGTLDDFGFLSEGAIDAPLNLDFTLGAKVILQPFDQAITSIVIAEEAGLDAFRLEYSLTPDFKTKQVLFNGFSLSVRNGLLARDDFGKDDVGSDLDQFYVFLFDQPLAPGYLRITDIGNLGGSRLELDFVGVGTPIIAETIPEPNAFILAAAGVLMTVLLLSRRR